MITHVKPINSSTDSPKENDDSEKLSFSSKWRDFASVTTLHGLRYVVQDGLSFSRRAIWFLFLCIAATAYTYYGTISLRKYVSKPVKTVISQETPTDGLKFPAVTICNLNLFMKSKIDVADDDENFENMGLNISGCSETRAVRGNLTCGQALLCAYGWFGEAVVKGCNKTIQQDIIDALNRSSDRLFNEAEFLTNYGHDMAGMFVVYCRFMKGIKCSDKDFVPKLTPEGICFTFNSGRRKTALHELLEGPDLGLNILLDVQTNETTLGQFSTGLKVIVHDQNTFVNWHSGFNILPGTQATVAVKLRKHIRLPAPFKTDCRQEKLPGIGTYTKDGCIYQCIANTTVAQCGCRSTGLRDPEKVPLCSFQDQGCVEKSQKDVNLKACSCSNACSELEYESRVSYSKFPSDSIIEILHHFYGKLESDNYMKENYVFLQVGFQHLAYEQREDVSTYGAESLLGEWGGNMGLFLGCSLLTLCEFIHFLVEVVMARIRKRSVQTTPNPNSNS
ncbi:acid-sensing ion channel 2-like isoform X1 [Oculina patagonica]